MLLVPKKSFVVLGGSLPARHVYTSEAGAGRARGKANTAA